MGRGGYVYADADRRGNVAKRRQKDLEFLARVIELREQGDVKGLAAMLRDHAKAPEWKQVAIKRALKAAAMRPMKLSRFR